MKGPGEAEPGLDHGLAPFVDVAVQGADLDRRQAARKRPHPVGLRLQHRLALSVGKQALPIQPDQCQALGRVIRHSEAGRDDQLAAFIHEAVLAGHPAPARRGWQARRRRRTTPAMPRWPPADRGQADRGQAWRLQPGQQRAANLAVAVRPIELGEVTNSHAPDGVGLLTVRCMRCPGSRQLGCGRLKLATWATANCGSPAATGW